MGARVLVIEDNEKNLELVVYLLGAFGHEVVAARSGEAGLKAIQEARPDLVVCDLQMPGISGYDVARALKLDLALRSIPLVAVTALAMLGDRDKVLAAGFDGYLTKPIDPETFVEQIDCFLPSAVRSVTPSTSSVPSVQSAPPREEPAKATVLIVDNVGQNIALLYSLLSGLGLRLLSAANVAEALGLARESRPSLIVTDIHMPKQSGYDLLRALHAEPALSSIPLLFVTASVRYEADEKKARSLGAAGIITRDTEPALIRQQILACLPSGHCHPDVANPNS